MRIITLISFAFCAAFALDRSHLSEEIQSAIAHKEAAIEAGRKRLKYDFIGSASLSGSITESKSGGSDEWSRSEQASAQFSQDLFRSGGISASIRYAGFWAQSEQIKLTQEINGYLQNLTTYILQYRQDRIRLEQNALALKNAEIAALIKQKQYEAGETDITQLNDALQTRNNLRKTRLDLEHQRISRLEEIAKITPLDPETLPLAPFNAINEDEYLSRSLTAQLAKLQSEIAKTQQSITTSSYLPTLSASAGASYTKTQTSDGESYNYGLRLSMPLSVTEGWSIEEKKLETLRAKSQERTTIEGEKRAYAQSQSAIKATTRGIEVSQENIALYDSLLSATKAQAESGTTSRFDPQTLENSRASDLLDIELSQISIQIELAKLYYATDKENDK
ncbi:MAG: TolC family protein [Helicobacteraceae bacterium]|jgi:outer membrane protein TolC|nr:TolC family protein [Helicobacteraceae bacterium]